MFCGLPHVASVNLLDLAGLELKIFATLLCLFSGRSHYLWGVSLPW